MPTARTCNPAEKRGEFQLCVYVCWPRQSLELLGPRLLQSAVVDLETLVRIWRPSKGTPPGRREFGPPVVAGGHFKQVVCHMGARGRAARFA